MMADAIWNFTTSSWVLGIDTIIFSAALVVGYFPLLKYFPVIGPYVPAAKLISFLMAALICFMFGFRLSDERDAAKNLKAQLAAKTMDLDATREAYDEAETARSELANQAKADQERIAQYADQLKKRPMGSCTISPSDLGGM